MAKSGSVIWHGDELKAEVKKLMLDKIDEVALEVIIDSDPPIDTGFLDASAYINSATGLNTFDQRWADGRFISRKTTRLQLRRTAKVAEPHPVNGAVVAWSAIYAAYVEERTHFIYKALRKVAARHT